VVRLFPRATGRAPSRRRAAVSVAVAGALLGAATVPGAAWADLGGDRDEVEKKIEKAHEHVDASSAELQAATDALLRAQSDLAAAQAHLAKTQGELAAARALDRQMQERLDAAVLRLQKARAELRLGQAEVREQERQVRSLVVAAYQQGDPALLGLSMVLTTQDPAELAGSMSANSSVVNRESTVLDRLEAAKVMLSVREDELEDAKEEVRVKRVAAAENLARMEVLEQQAREATEQVAELVELRKEARAVALEAKRADLATLAKLQAERARIEALILAQASRGRGYTGPVSGNGFLSMPVDGRITSPFGWRTHPIWGYRSLHDGIDFGATCGTPIRAAAAGTVLSTYYQSAWGNRIIIDHGVKYGVGVATISNHLEGYAVAQGQRVERGQVIGYVGSTGWSTGCHLHYTVMENGVPVDPMRWF
jgi:murein DD-endopeptidase MepM/ murein hydrolase activator NlpD